MGTQLLTAAVLCWQASMRIARQLLLLLLLLLVAHIGVQLPHKA
jgi:hypothetical protein